MQFRRIEQEEWQSLHASAYALEEIRARVTRLVDWLATFFNDQTVGGVSGLKFGRGSEPGLACEIETPCGFARMLLEWAMYDGNLHGLVVLERKRSDEHGAVCWEKVWAFYVPDRGKVFVEDPSDGFQLRSGVGKQLENDLFEIGMSIFFAVVSGPVLKQEL